MAHPRQMKVAQSKAVARRPRSAVEQAKVVGARQSGSSQRAAVRQSPRLN